MLLHAIWNNINPFCKIPPIRWGDHAVFFFRPFPYHIMQGTKVPAWLVADPQYQRCTIAWRPNHLCLRGTNLLGGWTNPYSKKITTHPDIAHRSAIPETANYERDPQSSLFVKVFFGCVPKVCWNNLRHMQNMRPSNWIISPRLRVKIKHIWVATRNEVNWVLSGFVFLVYTRNVGLLQFWDKKKGARTKLGWFQMRDYDEL